MMMTSNIFVFIDTLNAVSCNRTAEDHAFANRALYCALFAQSTRLTIRSVILQITEVHSSVHQVDEVIDELR